MVDCQLLGNILLTGVAGHLVKGYMTVFDISSMSTVFGHDYFEEPYPAITRNFLWPVPPYVPEDSC